jgi:DNA-binding protein HU-beta
MNKTDLINAMAEGADISKAAAGKALEAAIEAITKAVASGDNVALIGFGTFKATERAAREGKNPKTGEVLQIAAATVPKFSAGAAFKAAVAKK